jgi:hypothetical protein
MMGAIGRRRKLQSMSYRPWHVLVTVRQVKQYQKSSLSLEKLTLA